jgi:spore coat polysaccharide biosynthesis predicted glycosyltransferase SpsG
MKGRETSVIFAAAAGPRRGFGHLARCRALARVMGAPMHVALRGSQAAAAAAVRMGWTVHDDLVRVLRRACPRLVVIDDPSPAHAARFARLAREAGVPAASIHDLGQHRAPSDLTIDGSLSCVAGSLPADLQGPEFAILDPIFERIRQRRPARHVNRVLIALGGGAHVRAVGVRVAVRVSARAPYASVDLAAGMVPLRHAPDLPAGCRWIPSAQLAESLATATTAIVGGGITLYEACALGTPVVALPVTLAQSFTTRAFATRGAALDAWAPTRAAAADRAASLATDLLTRSADAARLGRQARRLIDARGAHRVAARLLALAHASGDLHVA